MGIHTQYKFRHYGVDSDSGARALLWASDGEKASIEPRKNELIMPGSALENEVIQSQLWTSNTVTDEGEEDFLNVYFKAQAVRASLYFRLYTDAGLTQADTLATAVGEESAGGYAAITVTRDTDWGAVTAATGTTSVTKTFTASATWSALNSLVLATVASGTAGELIAWANLSTTRSLVNLDTLDVDMQVIAEGV